MILLLAVAPGCLNLWKCQTAACLGSPPDQPGTRLGHPRFSGEAKPSLGPHAGNESPHLTSSGVQHPHRLSNRPSHLQIRLRLSGRLSRQLQGQAPCRLPCFDVAAVAERLLGRGGASCLLCEGLGWRQSAALATAFRSGRLPPTRAGEKLWEHRAPCLRDFAIST
jgi:hypothetical protein